MVRRLQRWLVFNAVGTMGVGVQLTALVSLTEVLGLNYLVSTVLAVESAILHNFVWHEHWTWRDRRPGIRGRWTRLAWFNVVTGTLSISSNVVLTALYVSTLGVHYAIANLMAIATCSLLTFVASDRFVYCACRGGEDMTTGPSVSKELEGAEPAADLEDGDAPHRTGGGSLDGVPRTEAEKTENRSGTGDGDVMVHALQPKRRPERPAGADLSVRAALVAALLTGASAAAAAAEPEPRTVAAWNRYVEATERRIAAELGHAQPDRFLVQDFRDGAAEARRDVLAGRVRIDELETRDAGGERIRVPKGAIHHWLGSALIPDVTLDEVLHALIYTVEPEALQDDVIESRVLARPGEDRLEVFLKLRRKQMVTVHYNTEHAVAYTRHRPGAASSRSVATRIAELDDAGTARERERPTDRDRGFLWRLNSYWRYRQVDAGVIVECESLSLSRSIPRLLRWMAAPLINRAARDILARTLASMADVLSARAGYRMKEVRPRGKR